VNTDRTYELQCVESLFLNNRKRFYDLLQDFITVRCRTRFFRAGGKSIKLTLDEFCEAVWARIFVKWHVLRAEVVGFHQGKLQAKRSLAAYLSTLLKHVFDDLLRARKKRPRDFSSLRTGNNDEERPGFAEGVAENRRVGQRLDDPEWTKERQRRARVRSVLLRWFGSVPDLGTAIERLKNPADRALIKLDLCGKAEMGFPLSQEEAAYRLWPDSSDSRTTGEVVTMLLTERSNDPMFVFTNSWVEEAYGKPKNKRDYKYSQYCGRAYSRLLRDSGCSRGEQGNDC